MKNRALAARTCTLTFASAIVAAVLTAAALISFLLGLIIVMLGIIGEYIWRIFDEVNHRPESVIEEVY